MACNVSPTGTAAHGDSHTISLLDNDHNGFDGFGNDDQELQQLTRQDDIHNNRRPTLELRRPSSIETGGKGSGSNSRSGSGNRNGSLRDARAPRTPRTPRLTVRFDLPESGSNAPTLPGSPSAAAHIGNGSANDNSQRNGRKPISSTWGREASDCMSTGDVEAQEARDYRRSSSEDGDDGHEDEDEEDNHNAPLLPSATGPIESALELDNPLDRKTSSLKAAISNMSNSIMGAGIIGQPYALKEAGMATGVILLIVLTVVVDWTIRLIVMNSKMSGRNTFQGTVEFCYGKWGLLAISLAQWAFAFGGMVAFAVIVGDSIPPVLQAVFPGIREVPVIGWLAGRTGSIVVFCGGISWPLSLYRDISKLAKASTLALISMLVIVITVVSQGFSVPKELRGEFQLQLWTINSGIFQAIGVISFAFVCHHNTLLIYSSLSVPTISRFSLLTHISTSISLLACLVMALSGFLTFGDKTSGNVLNNFPTGVMVNAARFCFGLNMLTTLPLEAFVCREVCVNYFWPNAVDVQAVDGVASTAADPLAHAEGGGETSTLVHVGLTTVFVWGATIIATQVCDLGAVFEIIGATSASILAYILPPLCYLKLSKKQDWRRKAAWAVVAFGTMVAGMSLVMSLYKIIWGTIDPAKKCHF